MGKQTTKNKIKEKIAHIGWWLFIRFQYGGNEEKYHNEKDCETLCQKGVVHCLVCGSLEHAQCDNFPV